MEKSKKKRVAWAIIKSVVALAVFAGMFAISISAGICSIVFSGIGYAFGFFNRSQKTLNAFMDKIVENIPDLNDGKTLVFTLNEEDNSFSTKIVEPYKKKNKKKEA